MVSLKICTKPFLYISRLYQLNCSENIHESFGAIRIDLREEFAAFM
jgi:hypothetical protein